MLFIACKETIAIIVSLITAEDELHQKCLAVGDPFFYNSLSS